MITGENCSIHMKLMPCSLIIWKIVSRKSSQFWLSPKKLNFDENIYQKLNTVEFFAYQHQNLEIFTDLSKRELG